MRSLAGLFAAILGVSSFLATVWAFQHLLPLVSDVLVLRRAGSYAPAVFEVEWAALDDDQPVAIGTIGGKREVLALRDVLSRPATSLNDLQDLTAKTDRLSVLYDPGGTKTSFEGAHLRVLPATPDLRAERERRLARTVLVGYGPVLLLLGLGQVVAWVGGTKLGCWFRPTLFFLALLPLFVLFFVVIELFG